MDVLWFVFRGFGGPKPPVYTVVGYVDQFV